MVAYLQVLTACNFAAGKEIHHSDRGPYTVAGRSHDSASHSNRHSHGDRCRIRRYLWRQSSRILCDFLFASTYSVSADAKSAQASLVNSSTYSNALNSIAHSTEVNENTKLFGSRLANMSSNHRNLILNGANIYKTLCSTCHGPDGKGIVIGGGSAAAPPFVGSKRVSGDKELLAKILLNGLSGPIDGKTYTDVMAPLGAPNNDEWVASVLSYVRYNFGKFERGKSPVVDVETVKKVREIVAGRDKFWTLDELEK